MSFLFISKLIPLFLYPLGLACVLLIVALLLSWKNSRWTPLPVFLALIVILLGSNGWVSSYLVTSLEWQNIPAREIPTAEAIILLGGATRSAYTPRPMVDVSEEGDRVLYAAKLYQDRKAPIIIATGGRIYWRGGGKPESADMASLLEMMGVPEKAIIQEPSSLNTYQNAVNVRKILEERGIKRVLLVTSAMHMPRSLLIFKKQGIEAIPAATDYLVSEYELQEINSSTESIILNILPEADHLRSSTRAIKEYIGTLIYRLRGWL